MSRPRDLRALALLLSAAGALYLLWPGDAPFISDEPRFITLAWRCLQAGVVASHGLMGTRGLAMGPAPVWLYELGLALTRDLVALVFLRCALFAGLCALSLWWLARACPALKPPLGAAALLSPYLWLYARHLWDTFYFPLSGLTLSAYVLFCVEGKAWQLFVAALCGTLLALTHLMSGALLLPMLLHFLYFQRGFIERRPALSAGLAAAALLLCAPYLLSFFAVSAPHAPLASFSPWRGWLFPLWAGRLFAGWGLDYFLGEGWRGGWTGALSWASAAALPLVWAGAVLAGRSVRQGPRDGDFHMSLLALGALAAACALHGLSRAYGHPHYYGALWLPAFYLLWRALGTLPKPAAAAFAGTCACLLLAAALRLHEGGGNRELHYGPTLANQVAVAQGLTAYQPNSPIRAEAAIVPQSIETLVEVYGLVPRPDARKKALVIRYASQDPASGRIELAEAP